MSWKRSFIHVLLAVSVGANIWLVQRTTALERSLAELTARPALAPGAEVPDLELYLPSGAPAHVRYEDSPVPTVLYVVSPTCNWCKRNADSVAALAKATQSSARWIGIALEPRAQASAGNRAAPPQLTQAAFEVYSGLGERAAKALRLRSTPSTIVVSRDGTVLAVWEGAYGGKVKEEIEAHFGVSLPPLATE